MRPFGLALYCIGPRLVKIAPADGHAVTHRRAALFDVVEVSGHGIDMDIARHQTVIRDNPLRQETLVQAPRIGAAGFHLGIPGGLLRRVGPGRGHKRAGGGGREQRRRRSDEMSACQHVIAPRNGCTFR